jgi:hypothetical protein
MEPTLLNSRHVVLEGEKVFRVLGADNHGVMLLYLHYVSTEAGTYFAPACLPQWRRWTSMQEVAVADWEDGESLEMLYLLMCEAIQTARSQWTQPVRSRRHP